LAEKQLDAAGLSNFTNVGGTPRRTRKTDPKALEAVAVAKANNIPIPATGPQPNSAMAANIEKMRAQFKNLGANGFIKAAGGVGNKTVVTQNPRGPGALVNGIVHGARQTMPLSRMGSRYEPLPGRAKEDSEKLQSLLRK
jgi:NAD(P)H-dependent flavin oxidoreductase YrpB (nitropropane dioxygenase family)